MPLEDVLIGGRWSQTWYDTMCQSTLCQSRLLRSEKWTVDRRAAASFVDALIELCPIGFKPILIQLYFQ